MTGCPAPSPQRTSVSRAGPGADRDGCQRVVAAAWAGIVVGSAGCGRACDRLVGMAAMSGGAGCWTRDGVCHLIACVPRQGAGTCHLRRKPTVRGARRTGEVVPRHHPMRLELPILLFVPRRLFVTVVGSPGPVASGYTRRWPMTHTSTWPRWRKPTRRRAARKMPASNLRHPRARRCRSRTCNRHPRR